MASIEEQISSGMLGKSSSGNFKHLRVLKPRSLKKFQAIKIRRKLELDKRDTKMSFVKPNTIAKAATIYEFDSIIFDISRIEDQLKEVKNLGTHSDKQASILDVCDLGTKFPSEFLNFFVILKETLSDLFRMTDALICNSQERMKSFEESSQALKIMKKRFQKMACENLELNHMVNEKEKKNYKLNEKLKILKNSILKNDQDECIKSLKITIASLKSEIEKFNNAGKTLNTQEMRNSKPDFFKSFEKIPDENKTKILGLLEEIKEVSSPEANNLFVLPENFLLSVKNSARCSSFLSDSEFITEI